MTKIFKILSFIMISCWCLSASAQDSLLLKNRAIGQTTDSVIFNLKKLIRAAPDSKKKYDLINSTDILTSYVKQYREQFRADLYNNTGKQVDTSKYEQVNSHIEVGAVLLKNSLENHNIDSIKATVSVLISDYKMKTQHTLGVGWNTNYPSPKYLPTVKVKVRTISRRTGAEVGGYMVHCRLADAHTSAYVTTFGPTPSASDDIIPGLVKFWIELPGAKRLERDQELIWSRPNEL
jgi:hypothetical protein